MRPNLVLNYINNFKPDERGKARGLILSGLPGVGKTHFCKEILPTLIPITPIIYNASLSRDKAFFNKIKQESQTYSIMGLQKVIILDECEKLPTGQLKKTIEQSEVPIILICNFLDEIDWEIKKICDVTNIERPFDWEIEKYLMDISSDSKNYSIPPPLFESTHSLETIKSIAHKARSYRHAKQLLDNEYDDGIINRTPIEQIQDSLSGEFIDIQEWKVDAEDLITWMSDNTQNSRLLSLATKSLRVDQDMIYRYLSLIRWSGKVKYPYTWRLIGEVKKEKREREENKDGEKKEHYEPRIKVRITGIGNGGVGTFTNQDITKIIKDKNQENIEAKTEEWV